MLNIFSEIIIINHRKAQFSWSYSISKQFVQVLYLWLKVRVRACVYVCVCACVGVWHICLAKKWNCVWGNMRAEWLRARSKCGTNGERVEGCSLLCSAKHQPGKEAQSEIGFFFHNRRQWWSGERGISIVLVTWYLLLCWTSCCFNLWEVAKQSIICSHFDIVQPMSQLLRRTINRRKIICKLELYGFPFGTRS